MPFFIIKNTGKIDICSISNFRYCIIDLRSL